MPKLPGLQHSLGVTYLSASGLMQACCLPQRENPSRGGWWVTLNCCPYSGDKAQDLDLETAQQLR